MCTDGVRSPSVRGLHNITSLFRCVCHTTYTEVCGVWCVVCGVWCVVCGVWCVMCGVCVCMLRVECVYPCVTCVRMVSEVLLFVPCITHTILREHILL